MAWPDYVVVSGAGARDINGVFTIEEGVSYEGCPVYGSLSGFSLSVCQCPDESGNLQWGWIIGQGGTAAYGSMTSQKEVIPSKSWQCFQGQPPEPTLRLIHGESTELAAAYLEEARRRCEVPLKVQAFRKSMACQRRWDQRALLHVELAQCLHGSEKVDQALRELNEAQKLWPSCPDALLLLAQIYADTLQLPEARLAAAQCHAALGSSGSKMLKDCQKVLQELQVSGQEAVLPQNYFANLFEQLIDLTNDDRATGSSDLGPMREFVAAVEVKGSSLREVNGVYEPSRVISNHFAVFQNSYGFRMSLETMSRKGAESDSVRGWVIGKDRVGFFRTAQVAENGLPSGEWTCFPAASGSTAPSGTSSKLSRIEDAILQVHAARLAGSSCSAVTASAVACLKLWRGPYEDLWKAAFVLTELAGLFRQHGLHQRALEVVSKALELCPSHWEAYLEVACIHDDLGESSQAILPLQQLLTARPTDGRAASMLLQLSKDLKDKEFDAWLKDHRDIPLVAEALASHDSSKPQGKDVDGPEVGADFQLEDQKEEVHAHWTLPRDIISKDLDVKFRQDWLQVQVKGQLLFEAELAHQIQPADSSWTFSSPHLTVMLSKCPVDGKWPRWEVLHKEDPASRLQRLGGLPFDRNAIRWF